MDVHLRDSILDRPQNVTVIKFREIAWEATLDADFGRAEFPSLERFSGHLVQAVKVGVVLTRAAAECAEFASHKTNVGEIHVAVDDVGHDVSDQFGAQEI